MFCELSGISLDQAVRDGRWHAAGVAIDDTGTLAVPTDLIQHREELARALSASGDEVSAEAVSGLGDELETRGPRGLTGAQTNLLGRVRSVIPGALALAPGDAIPQGC